MAEYMDEHQNFQDRWQATRCLTDSAGIRYEFLPATNLQPGYASIFNPAKYSAAQVPIVNANGTITPTPNFNPTNGLIFNGLNGVPLNLTTMHQSFWAPTVGFAWDVFGNGKTALRGGYGITYQDSPYQTNCANTCAVNPPLIQSLTLIAPSFPNPIGAAVKPASAPNLNSEALNIRPGQVQTYSLSLEHQFAGDWLASIAGAGNIARHVGAAWNVNQPLPDGAFDCNPIINTGTVFPYLFSPYQGYGSINTTEPGLNAYWDALEVGVRHPVGHNLFLSVAYTWQHDLSETGGPTMFNNEAGPQDVYRPGNDYGNSYLNVPQILTFSYVYDLPWYKNGRGWKGLALGGWRYAGMTTIQSGFSLTPGLSVSHQGLATRSDYAGGSVVGPKTAQQWFNTAAFAAPPFGYFGNATPGSIPGPGVVDFDMAVYKDFHITERNMFEFRAEAFNAFNRANFSGIQTAVGTRNYGQVTSALDPRIFELSLRYGF